MPFIRAQFIYFLLTPLAVISLVSYGEELSGSAPLDDIEAAIQTARDPSKGPEKWTETPEDYTAPRYQALQALKDRKDEYDRTEPVFRELIESATEDPIFRKYAMEALFWVGTEASPLLKELINSQESEIRHRALGLFASRIGMEQGRAAMEEYYRQVVKKDPFDPNVGRYLTRMKGAIGPASRTDPVTQDVKEKIRARVKEKPDAELAWTLAEILQQQSPSTFFNYSQPVPDPWGGWGNQPNREDPNENLDTLEEVLRLGFDSADEDSDLFSQFGSALARVQLLRGNWDGMNEILKRIGVETVKMDEIPWLSPPGIFVSDSDEVWSVCDESLRSGTCGFKVRVTRDGRGFKGAQVRIQKADPPLTEEERNPKDFTTGWRDPPKPFHWRFPVPPDYSRGPIPERAETAARFGVTDESGEVFFESLPKIPLQLYVYVPDGLIEGGAYGLSVHPNQKDVWIDKEKPIELVEGETVEYPTLEVRPILGFNVQDWDEVDPNSFVLSWPPAISPSIQNVTYTLDLTLFGPPRPGDFSDWRINHQRIETNSASWPLGERGVNGLQIAPGNMYLAGLSARNASGESVGSYLSINFWTGWGYRETDAPCKDRGPRRECPIGVHMKWTGKESYSEGGGSNVYGQPSKTRKQVCEEFLAKHPNAFEADYVRVGMAFYEWHEGNRKAAEIQLRLMDQTLPKGNVAQLAASDLLERLMIEGSLPPVFTLGGKLNAF